MTWQPGGLNGAHVFGDKYRLTLWRTFKDQPGPPMVFVMLNPSTADALQDDPTIRRCCGFARREGCGGIVVVNLSPWRATDPAHLDAAIRRGEDVELEEKNREAMLWARDVGGLWVLAWGSGIRPWMDRAARTARSIAPRPMCLGKTKMGEPRHPLMLASSTPLVEFP
jgi:hypothetical protein